MKRDDVLSVRVNALDRKRLQDLRMYFFEHTGELRSFSEIIRALVLDAHNEIIGGNGDGEAEEADV